MMCSGIIFGIRIRMLNINVIINIFIMNLIWDIIGLIRIRVITSSMTALTITMIHMVIIDFIISIMIMITMYYYQYSQYALSFLLCKE